MLGWTLAALSPKEVAPVVGRGSSLGAMEALALVVLGRFQDYERLNDPSDGEQPGLFPIEDQDSSPEWELVRAAAQSMMHPTEAVGMERLSRLVHDAVAPAEIRGVSGLFLAISYADMDRSEEASGVSKYLNEENLSLPVLTSVALHVQQGLREAELGEYAAARESCARALELLDETTDFPEYCAKAAQEIKVSNVSDVFRRVEALLRAAASRNSALLDSMVEVTEPGFAKIQPDQTPNRSLRDQLLAGVTSTYIKEFFEREVRDRAYFSRPQTIGRENVVSRDLHALWLCSQLSGDWVDTLAASEILGREWLLREGEDRDTTLWLKEQGVRLLRTSGSSKAYEQAIRLMREEGPLRVLKKEIVLALGRLAGSPSKAGFEVIRAGAPLLTQGEADSACSSILTHQFPAYQTTVGGGWFSTREPMWNAIAALSSEISDRDSLSAALRERLSDGEPITAHSMLRVLSRLDWRQVSPDERNSWIDYLSENVSAEIGEVRDAVLYELAKQGNRRALELFEASLSREPDLGQVATLTDLHQIGFSDPLVKRAVVVLDVCKRAISKTMEEASHGAYSFGGVNEGLIAAIISVDFPSMAVWSEVSALLRHRKVPSHKKDPILGFLARKFENVPESVRMELSQDPTALKSPQISGMFPVASSGASGPRLRFLAKSKGISTSEALAEFIRLVRDVEVLQRVEAARSTPVLAEVLGSDLTFGFVLTLLSDRSALPRAEAAEVLAYFANLTGDSASHAVNAIGDCLAADGVAVPFGALRGIQRYGLPEDRELADRMRSYLARASQDSLVTRVRAISLDFLQGNR